MACVSLQNGLPSHVRLPKNQIEEPNSWLNKSTIYSVEELVKGLNGHHFMSYAQSQTDSELHVYYGEAN